MNKIKVNALIPHPDNELYFDNIVGTKWDELVESIRSGGLYTPLVVTADNIIVSGHQRYRACIELGIEEVPCIVREFADEDAILKELIETNLRQRGDVNGDPLKTCRRIHALTRIYKLTRGGDRKSKVKFSPLIDDGDEWLEDDSPMTQADLAAVLGISKDALKSLKKLILLNPELQELVSNGKLSANAASRLLSKLAPEEQRQIFEMLPEEVKTAEGVKIPEALLLEKIEEARQIWLAENQGEIIKLQNAVAIYQQEDEENEKKLEKLNKRNHMLETKLAGSQDQELIDEINALKAENRRLYEEKEAAREKAVSFENQLRNATPAMPQDDEFAALQSRVKYVAVDQMQQIGDMVQFSVDYPDQCDFDTMAEFLDNAHLDLNTAVRLLRGAAEKVGVKVDFQYLKH